MTAARSDPSTGQGAYESGPVPVSVLAAQALEAQRLAPVGSTRRKSAGVLAVVLADAKSLEGARRMLLRRALPEDVRKGAAALLYQLAAPTPEGDPQP